jgi:putative membrane protein
MPVPQSTIPAAQRRLLGLLLALLLVAQIDQPYPEVALLQHIPTALLLALSPWLLRRWPMSTASVACLTLFMALHTLGGRYAYSNVPYDEWARAMTGTSLADAFGWTRNHYDRLVHFAFGALSVIPVAEIARRWGGLGWRGAGLAVLGWVLAISCLYEIFEWLLTIVAAGDTADRYNGQQGDIWDAQKDMALALSGAILVLAIPRRDRRESCATSPPSR